MAWTREQVLEAASAQRLVDTYDLTTEHSRVAMAAPIPFNIVLGESPRTDGALALDYYQRKTVSELAAVLEGVKLACNWRRLLVKYPDCPFGRRIDLYLSRNKALPAAGAPHAMNLNVAMTLPQGLWLP